MKLTIDCRMLKNSGIGVYVTHIIEHLGKKGYPMDISYICNKDQADSMINITGCDKRDLILFKSKPFSIYEQIEYLTLKRCDILWIPHINIPFQKFRTNKLLVTIHDVFHLAHPEYYSFAAISYFKGLFKMLGFLADKIITVSKFSESEIIRYTSIKSSRIKVIYNGTDPLADEKESFDVNTGKYMLFVGNVKPHKNVAALINAFNNIAGNFEDWSLIIVGKKDGFFLNSEMKIFEDNPKIIFTGLISDEDLASYYNNCDLFVFPSLYEGFGLPLLEAMHFNVNILASQIASIPEVGKDKINYFNPLEDGDLEKQLIKLMSSQNQTLPLGYYEAILKEFTWENAVEQHLSLMKEI